EARTHAKAHPDAVSLESAHSDTARFTDAGAWQQSTLRALVHSLAHDLAQPLTSVRCFLEMMDMHNGKTTVQPEDIRNIEQQADRAISLTRGISALVRESPVPAGQWTALDTLLNDVFNDFLGLVHSGLLALNRQWDSGIQVTSSPVLRQLIVLFLSKLAGRNSTPLQLTIAAHASGGRCTLEFKWTSNNSVQPAVHNARNIFGKELSHVHELARSIAGEMVLGEEAS